MIRSGKYTTYKNRELEFIFKGETVCRIIFRGRRELIADFEGFKEYSDNVYYLDINCEKIPNAFYVNTFCIYNGSKFILDKKLVNGKFRLLPTEETQKFLKETSHHGYDPVYEVEESEITEIWEERNAISGFEFVVDPILWIKERKESK